MMNFLASIDWNVEPQAFSIFGRPIMWYGIFWVIGVALTAFVVNKMFKAEKKTQEFFDSFFVYIVISLIIGARLGHCLFYDPVEYLSSPLSLFKIWEGGLASHGGAIGMLIGVCLFSMKQSRKTIRWKKLLMGALIGAASGWLVYIASHFTENIDFFDFSNSLMLGTIIMGISIGVCVYFIYDSSPMCIAMLDRLIVGVCIGATFIRLGNLMNSEIFGFHTNLPWGFNFLRSRDWIHAGSLPSHPTQIYEALIYFCLFLLTMFLYWKTKAKEKTGLIIGVSLVGIFGSRILVESIKNTQVGFEENMILNLGQLLSIPFVLWGIYLVYYAFSSNKKITIKK